MLFSSAMALFSSSFVELSCVKRCNNALIASGCVLFFRCNPYRASIESSFVSSNVLSFVPSFVSESISAVTIGEA